MRIIVKMTYGDSGAYERVNDNMSARNQTGVAVPLTVTKLAVQNEYMLL